MYCNIGIKIKEISIMQIIEIVVENKKYQIEWALSEYFGELIGN